MADEDKPRGYLARYGGRLIDAGYQIIPIRRGSKAPPFDDWQKTRATKKQLNDWLDGQYKRSGVGLLTRNTPAVDLDILDEPTALHMERFVQAHFGIAPLRIGMAPKRLLLFRSDAPFPKINSSVYEDEWGNPQASFSQSGKPTGHLRKIEILGDGQQFVAFAIHPDTGKPYEWIGDTPITVPAAKLPLLSYEDGQAIVAEFDRVALENGWTVSKQGKALTRLKPQTQVGRIDHDDVFAADAKKVDDLSDEQLRTRLLLVPGAEDYETWLQIGMALFHQYDGEERGLELWHEWSETATNYDSSALDAKWDTFDITSKGRAPVTARLIIKLAAEAQKEIATEVFETTVAELKAAGTLELLRAACEKVKHIEFDVLARSQIVGIVQKRFKDIAGTPLTITTARDMVRFEQPEPKDLPRWLQGWVHVGHSDSFYNINRRYGLSTSAFNAVHNRFMLTKTEVLEGKSVPEAQAAPFALNNKQISLVQNVMYLPGEDDLFHYNGVPYVNSYDGRNVPSIPHGKLSKDERAAVETVKFHFEHLFENARDRRIFIDALAYVVQNPGKRLNWAILLQGTEGDGKTFFAGLLAAVLGPENVNNVVAAALEEKYSPWAEGAQVIFCEEIRLHGHNRFDVLNKIKPNITNMTVSVRKMNTDLYSAINTATYILTTNFRDALPLDGNDSRYFILFSRFQTRAALAAFEELDPTYYTRLFDSLEYAGALRKWLLGWEIGPDFDPKRRAPSSEAKDEMVSYAMSEESDALEEIISSGGNVLTCKILCSSTELSEALMTAIGEAPYGRAMNSLLLKAGFTKLKKVRIGSKTHVFWSQEPYRFRDPNGGWDEKKIQDWAKDDL